MKEPPREEAPVGTDPAETQAETNRKRPSEASPPELHHVGALCIMALILAVLNIMVPLMVPQAANAFGSTTTVGFFGGMILAELAVMSVWAVFAPLRLAIRWPLALLVCTIMFGFAFVGVSAPRAIMPIRVFVFIPLLMLAAQTPFWILKLLGGVQLVGRLADPESTRPLTIHDLLLGTVLIAVALGLARFGLAGESEEAWVGVGVTLGLLATVSLLLLPTLFLCLTSLPAGTAAIGVVAYAALLSGGTVLAVMLLAPAPRLEAVGFVVGFGAGAAAVMAGGLLTFRACEFRLGRQRRSAAGA